MLLLLASLALADPGRVPGVDLPEPADWGAVGIEAASLLSGYLQQDTTNPPGNEGVGAAYLAEILAAEGIGSTLIEDPPGRANLVARLPSSGAEPPVCLLSHIDVVTAEPARWPEGKGPLSGTIDEEGNVWGRGALDMKGMGIVELLAMIELNRSQVPLRRDVILLAVADEEVDNQGMRAVVDRHWGEIGCSHLINEGGVGLRDMFFPGQTVFPISVGEKGFLWTKMVASGEPGHGSTPLPDRSPARLQAALNRLSTRHPHPRYHESLLELLDAVGAHSRGLPAFILRRPGLVRALLRGRLMGNPLTRAAITDTVQVTGYGGALSPNVVPAESWAQLDIRMLPGTTAASMLEELTRLVDDPAIRFDVSGHTEAGVSEWHGDPFYEALAARVVEDSPNAVAGPVISVGFTDSTYVRPLGVRAYGLVPFAITGDEARTMHGDGEFVSTANLENGTRVLYRVLADVAGAPGGTWQPPPLPPG